MKFGTTIKAVAGAGAGTSSIFTIDGVRRGDTALTVDYAKGAMFQGGVYVRGDVLSSGEIDGAYQSFEICAIGCIRAAWGYRGNFNIGTKIVFPIAIGISVSGGVVTSGRDIVDFYRGGN